MLLDYNKSIQQVLQTGKYLTKYKIFSEEVALCQYLYTEEKKTKEEIFEIWKKTENPMTESYNLYHDIDDLRAGFNLIWSISMQKNLLYSTHYRPAKIWQEELDYINSLPVAQWFRKYLVCLLAMSKVFPSQPFPYSSLTVESVILKKIGMEHDMKPSKRQKMATWNQQLHLYETELNPLRAQVQMKVLIDYNIKDSGKTIDYNGIPLVITDNDLTGIEDILSLCDKGSVNCSKCGQKIIVGEHYQKQTDLCDECKSKFNRLVKCAHCGQEFYTYAHDRRPQKYCENCTMLNMKQFAQLCGVNPHTLTRWDRTGEFCARRSLSGSKYYFAADIKNIPKKATHKQNTVQNVQ